MLNSSITLFSRENLKTKRTRQAKKRTCRRFEPRPHEEFGCFLVYFGLIDEKNINHSDIEKPAQHRSKNLILTKWSKSIYGLQEKIHGKES